MKKLISYSFCLLMLINLGCQSDEDLVPSVVAIFGQPLEEGGVILAADFRNFSSHDELGFVLHSDSGSKEYPISNPREGKITMQINSGLYLDKKYRFIAYIKTKDGNYYSSLEKEFYSLGSVIPKINTISPAIGYIGDEIEINFQEKIEGFVSEELIINLAKTKVEIIEIVNDQKIKCRVPNFINPFENYTWAKMSITYLGKTVPCDYEFNIKAPRIDSVSPKLIDWDGEITIKGDFYKEGYPATVFLNIDGVPVTTNEIVEIKPTEIRLNVRNSMLINNPKIELWSNYRNIIETNTFSYYQPEIISFQQGNIGDQIEILGNYFWPAAYVNEVYFDNYKAKIIIGESKRLVVIIPEGDYSNNKAILKVKITDKIISEGKEFLFN